MATVSTDEPIRASITYGKYKSGGDVDAVNAKKSQRLATGCSIIDGVLQPGLPFGALTCFSVEVNSDARYITDSVIISHVLSSPSAEAIVIDTANTIDVRRIRNGIVHRLAQTHTLQDAGHASVLDRIKIMKAFDIVGLTESIAEMEDHFAAGSNGLPSAQQSTFVGDTEQDDNPHTSNKSKHNSEKVATADHLLVVDNISHVIDPVMKNNQVHAHAVLFSLLRSLKDLANTFAICTVIVNTSVSVSGTQRTSCPGAFVACNALPALDSSLAQLVDLHAVLQRLPQTEGKRTVNSTANLTSDMIYVLDVTLDRVHKKAGHWALFGISPDGHLHPWMS